MSTPIHPDLRTIARFMPRRLVTPRTLSPIRALMRLAARRRPADVDVHQVGPCSVRLHRPPGAGAGPYPGVLWMHGGGMVMGTAAQDDARCRRLARRLGAVVAAVDYRLAPEHPFPTPLDDCHVALTWLADRADVDAERIGIGGASAGGGLAAGLALLARDRGEVSPVVQVLVYPMLDDRTVLRTDIDPQNMRLWDNESNRFGWTSYLGRAPGGHDVSGLAAPARHDDLAGLPPAWIGVGTNDLFLDEDLAYAERLRAAGVACELDVVEGAFHGFDAYGRAAVSRDFIASLEHAFDAAFTAR